MIYDYCVYFYTVKMITSADRGNCSNDLERVYRGIRRNLMLSLKVHSESP